MLRYAVAAAAAVAIISGTAMAAPVGPTETTVKQTDHGTKITKHFINHRGEMVTKREAINGNMVTRSKTVRDPVTGASFTRSHTSE